jgi:prepilin-type N-terminal cleavage/methylation domain-containing protein
MGAKVLVFRTPAGARLGSVNGRSLTDARREQSRLLQEMSACSKNENPSGAFTLVESMVAISILSLAVTGPLLIAQKGVGSAIYARDQITAFYLAQEAVEYVRNVRDTNRIKGSQWLQGLSVCKESGSGQKCHIDTRYSDFTSPNAVTTCPAGACSKLSFYKNGTEGYYGYGSGANWSVTPYTREVTIDDRASSKEALVAVTISWNTNLFAPLRTFTIREYMFNF